MIFLSISSGAWRGKKRIENPNDIVIIRNPGQMRALISIFILQICRGSSSSELSSPKRCWQNLNFNADMQNEQWTQIENEIYYTLLHLIEWEILSEENDFGISISIHFFQWHVWKKTSQLFSWSYGAGSCALTSRPKVIWHSNLAQNKNWKWLGNFSFLFSAKRLSVWKSIAHEPTFEDASTM